MDKVVIGNATLYHGDALEILPTLGQCADLLVSDPPYKLTSGGAGNAHGAGIRMRGCFSSDVYDNKGGIVECDIDWPDFMPALYGCLKDQAHAYVMTNNRHIANCENAALDAGFRLHNWLVWDKRTATPNRWYMKNLEFVGFFYKGAAKYINNMSAKQLISIPQIDETEHPTEKPVSLMKFYIQQSSQPGQVVIDPFMGSGTTGVAAMQSKRNFIGIEKDRRWFDTACLRLELEEKQKIQWYLI